MRAGQAGTALGLGRLGRSSNCSSFIYHQGQGADRTTVVIKRCQASQSGRFAAIELTELGHLREQEPSRARANSANGSEFLRFNAKDLVLRDEIGDPRIECVDLLFDFANQTAA